MADTIAANLDKLECGRELLNAMYISRHVSDMGDFVKNSQIFNNKQDGRVTKENLKKLIVAINSDTDKDEFFDEAFRIGGAWLLTAVHYKVAKTLFTEPDFLAKESHHSGNVDLGFKKSSDIVGLKEYLKSVVKATPILPKKGPVRYLSALLESEEGH